MEFKCASLNLVLKLTLIDRINFFCLISQNLHVIAKPPLSLSLYFLSFFAKRILLDKVSAFFISLLIFSHLKADKAKADETDKAYMADKADMAEMADRADMADMANMAEKAENLDHVILKKFLFR